MSASPTHVTPLPTRWVGPIEINGSVMSEAVLVPLATYESPLWPSVARGARLSRHCGGISCTLVDERMARSIALRLPDAAAAASLRTALLAREQEIAAVVASTSRFARLVGIDAPVVGNLLYLRLECSTGDASGHNMVTKAADAVLGWVLGQYPQAAYSSISGNYCTDKKASAVNGIRGRGKYVVAEITVPRALCRRFLRTTPEEVVRLNTEKNHIGGILAGSLRSANAHFANMLLAFYLACGQDAANIIEGSQGIVHCEAREDALYFSCTLPNLILGTVGNGKGSEVIQGHLEKMGCTEARESGENARRLAVICAATVLCGELSLMAAQTNPGELMKAHTLLERAKS